MKHRKLRIAWSVTWGVVAVLLCVLWVRSYWYWDVVALQRPGGIGVVAVSLQGYLEFAGNPRFFAFKFDDVSMIWQGNRGALGPSDGTYPIRYAIIVLVAALTAATSWLRLPRRFSLRTLLIATTLVAVVLGLIVWGIR